MTTPKVAVLLCGYLRTWDTCRDSFITFMKDINYDLFIHTYTTIKGYHPYIRDTYNVRDNDVSVSNDEVTESIGLPFKKLVIEDEDPSAEEIRSVEQKDLVCYQWPNYDAYHDLQVLKGKGISIRTYLQYRKFRMCNELRKKYEIETGIGYDYVVKARMDLNYCQAPSLLILLPNIIPTRILTSLENSQPNDHIYIGRSEDIDKLLLGMQCVKLPYDREYSPHEYLYSSLCIAGLVFCPCIYKLNVVR